MRVLIALLGVSLALPAIASAPQPSSVLTIGLGGADWSDSPRWVGRFGSLANDVSVRGRTAYVLTDDTLETWDIDPANGTARRLGSTAGLDVTVGWPTALVVDGSLACVSYGLAGMLTVDVTDLAAPVVVGGVTLSGYAYDIAFSGSLACVATTGGVHLVDVSRTDAPQGAAFLPTTRPARLSLDGTLLYVSDPTAGLIIRDVSIPSQPIDLGALALTPGSGHVTARDARAFVARPGGVDMIDVSDPTAPRLIRSAALGRGPGKVTIKGGRLYVPDFATGEIRIWDWRRNRLLANTYTTSLPGRCEVTDADQLVVAGRVGFGVIRLDEPRQEGPRAPIALPLPITRVAAADNLVLAGRKLVLLDVEDPRRPEQIPISLPDGYVVNDVALRGSIAHVATARPGYGVGGYIREVTTIDLSQPRSPRILSSAPVQWNDGTLKLSPGFAAVSGGQRGDVLSFVDTSDPAALAPIGTYAAIDAADAAWIEPAADGSPGVAFASLPGFGLEIIDLSTGKPRYLSDRPLAGGASDVFVRDGVALVAGGDFHAVDVSDPSRPFLIQTIRTPGDARVLSVDRNVLYVADQASAALSGGIVAIDISNPRAPFVLGAVATGGNADDVAVDRNLVWVADGIGGLRVIAAHAQASASPSTPQPVPLARGAGDPTLALAGPNPLRGGSTVFDIANPLDQAVSVLVHDVRGRHVRSLATGLMTSGRHRLAWDGRDATGHRVGAGVYFVTLRAGDAVAARKIVVAATR